MKWYPYGHDFGNSQVGGVTVLNGRMCSRSIPTAFAKADTYIKNMALRNSIKAALDGTHVFTIDNGKTFRHVTIEVVTVVMEGAGALITYGDKSISKTTESAVIDIGGRTTDLYVARGQVPVSDYCKGKPLGVESAAQMLMDTFENEYERSLSLLEAREIMYAYASNGDLSYPDIAVYG